jgi:hypothetical protein
MSAGLPAVLRRLVPTPQRSATAAHGLLASAQLDLEEVAVLDFLRGDYAPVIPIPGPGPGRNTLHRTESSQNAP